MAKEVQGKTSSPLFIGGVVVFIMAATFGVGFLLNKDNGSGQEPNRNGSSNKVQLMEGDKIGGNQGAKIALIEYSDLECPYCKNFHNTAKQIVDEYEGEVMWVFRHFPLGIHDKARKEAEAAECADKLGGNERFWEMLDAIYWASPDIQLEDLPGLAGGIGLDVEEFTKCLDSNEMAQTVQDDYLSGLKVGVKSTPSNFLLNTKTGESREVSGAQPFSNFQVIIDQMLENE